MKPFATAAISASPFSGQQQVQEWPAEGWRASVTLPPMKRADAEPWNAFRLALRGMQGTFLLGDSAAKAPRGIATGTPLVVGTHAIGLKTIATDGWTINQTGILKAGDYLQVGTGVSQRLYKVLVDANSNGSGQATFDIFPRLREALSDNQAITISTCKGAFRLADNNQMQWDVDEALVYSVGFEAIEAL